MPLPNQYTFEEFITYALNFCMMMAYNSGQLEEYYNLYALLVYSGFDYQCTGFVDTNLVINQMIAYYSQIYPGLNQQAVNQVLTQNGIQLGGKINEAQFIQAYKGVAKMFQGQKPKGHP